MTDQRKKILIASYYGLKEALSAAAKSFKYLGYDICEYPLLRYSTDAADKRKDYVEHFNSQIELHKPDIILFWCMAISVEGLEYIRKKHEKIIFAFFSWDDPHNWSVSTNQLPEKAKNIDIAFPTCETSCGWYIQHGTKRAIFLPPAFDPVIHFTQEDMNFKCQVSFCITNLYQNEKRQKIPRKKLIDAIIADGTIDFRLYGPKHLADLYPKHYKGFVDYNQTRRIFANSMINLCTHIVGDSYKYINERCVLIAGCGGTLLVDPVPGIETLFTPGTECILMDESHPVKQIKGLLKDPLKLKMIGRNAQKRALREYTYSIWAEKIHKELQFIDK